MPTCHEDPTNPSCTCDSPTATKMTIAANNYFPGNPSTTRYFCSDNYGSTGCTPTHCPCYSFPTYEGCQCPAGTDKVIVTKGIRGASQGPSIDIISCCGDNAYVDSCNAVGWEPDAGQEETLNRINEKRAYWTGCNFRYTADPFLRRTWCESGYPRILSDSTGELTSTQTCKCAESSNTLWDGVPPTWAGDISAREVGYCPNLASRDCSTTDQSDPTIGPPISFAGVPPPGGSPPGGSPPGGSTSCDSDADCPSGKKCRDDICQVECTEDSHCADGFVCSDDAECVEKEEEGKSALDIALIVGGVFIVLLIFGLLMSMMMKKPSSGFSRF